MIDVNEIEALKKIIENLLAEINNNSVQIEKSSVANKMIFSCKRGKNKRYLWISKKTDQDFSLLWGYNNEEEQG